LRDISIRGSNRGIGFQQRTGRGAYRNVSVERVDIEARGVTGEYVLTLRTSAMSLLSEGPHPAPLSSRAHPSPQETLGGAPVNRCGSLRSLSVPILGTRWAVYMA
jgi:hypothetical protein